METVKVNAQEQAYFEQFAEDEAQPDPYAYLEHVDYFPTPQFFPYLIPYEKWKQLFERWKVYHPNAPI